MPAGTLRHLSAIVLLPGTGTILVPGAILWLIDSMNPGWRLPSPWWAIPVVCGFAAAFVGLMLVVKTVTLFWTMGKGTLAPWDPPTKLVVRGVYRHVRNPMISGVCFILLGEATVFGSFPLFIWFLIFLAVNLIYMPLVEEPRLARRFGRDYAVYRKNVPRWIPRLRPWNQVLTNDVDGMAHAPDFGAHDKADGARD
jgi:protein-S-isoprenylcysteine O-methyltransferase Ste14